MTISTASSPLSFNGDDTTTAFAITWKYFAKSDVVATLRSSTGTETVWALTTNYTLTDAGVDAGGTLTAVTAPATGETLVITLEPPNTQTASLPLGGPFPSPSVEDGLDLAAQRDSKIQEILDRTLRVPKTDTQTGTSLILPVDSVRANEFFTFDANGNPATASGTGVDSALRTDLGSTADVAKGDALVAGKKTDTGAVAFTLHNYHENRPINAKTDFGAKGDASTDDSSAIQAAIDAAAGRPVYFPSGTYVIGTKLTYQTTSTDAYTQGLQIIGDGPEETFFDNRVASDVMLAIDTDTDNKFQQGVRLSGFQIMTTTSPATSSGISIEKMAYLEMTRVKIEGLTGDGLKILIPTGDVDSSFHVVLRLCHFLSCAGWGLNAELGSGINELSFLTLDQVRFETCGTTSAATPPPSGGMIWKGQIAHLVDGACVTCENVGLFIKGEAGLANSMTCRNWAFENNVKRHVYITGLDGGLFERIQLKSNDSFVATNGFEIDGASFVTRNVLVDGVIVKATSGNSAYTAFKISGANADLPSIKIRRVVFADFDYAGQTRYDGLAEEETIISVNAGAAKGPLLDLHRDSPSPADNDFLGGVIFNGEDSAGNKEAYAEVKAQALDVTSTTEDGRLVFGTVIAGTLADRWFIGNGIHDSAATGGDKGAGIINVSGDIEKNDTAYTNPDFVLEHAFRGNIERFAENEGAAEYRGLVGLNDLRTHLEKHLRLPGIPDDSIGVFKRADKVLEKVEELFLYVVALHERLAALEKDSSDGH